MNEQENHAVQTKPPVKAIVRAAVIILIAEFVALGAIKYTPLADWIQLTTWHVWLVIVLIPMLYFLIFRPLNIIISQRRQAAMEYRTILQTALDGFWVTDREGRFLDANESYCSLIGYTRDELLKMSIGNLEVYQSPDEITRSIHEVMERGSGRFEVHHRSKSGKILTLELSINYLKDGGRFFVFGRDITQRREMEKALNETNEKLNYSVKILEQHNFEINLLAEMNTKLQVSLTTAEAYKVIGEFLKRLYPENSGALYIFDTPRNLAEPVITWGANAPGHELFTPEECWAVRMGRPYLSTNVSESTPGCRHGKNVSGIFFCVPLILQSEVSGILSIVFARSDLAKDKAIRLEQKKHMATNIAAQIGPSLGNLKLRESLQALSIRDHLTGLFNRRYMEESLERELLRASRKGTPVGIIMMDIDHFKDFNDRFGHAYGDNLMQNMGKFLRENIRESDIACRYGGEEFTLIIPDATLEATRQRAEYLREEFKKLYPQKGDKSSDGITISLGVSVYPEHGTTAEAVLKAADAALYKAKESGRDRVQVA
ncbi:MAG: diguanylate cyclase [Planctomycetes bacterium]|nr:diguanylate cyclase [Planctomycetota bacterium]